MEYFSVLKKNILLHATTWMNLENINLSEMSQSQQPQMLYDSIYMKNQK